MPERPHYMSQNEDRTVSKMHAIASGNGVENRLGGAARLDCRVLAKQMKIRILNRVYRLEVVNDLKCITVEGLYFQSSPGRSCLMLSRETGFKAHGPAQLSDA